MLSGPHQKFAEGIALGLNGTEAYQAAYPEAKATTAAVKASALVRNGKIKAEVERIRKAAEVLAGGCVLTVAMKRQFLYEVVATPIDRIGPDSHLCQSYKRARKTVGRGEEAEEWETEEFKVPDKIAAIKADNDLAGEGSEAKGNEAMISLAALVADLRK